MMGKIQCDSSTYCQFLNIQCKRNKYLGYDGREQTVLLFFLPLFKLYIAANREHNADERICLAIGGTFAYEGAGHHGRTQHALA